MIQGTLMFLDFIRHLNQIIIRVSKVKRPYGAICACPFYRTLNYFNATTLYMSHGIIQWRLGYKA